MLIGTIGNLYCAPFCVEGRVSKRTERTKKENAKTQTETLNAVERSDLTV